MLTTHDLNGMAAHLPHLLALHHTRDRERHPGRGHRALGRRAGLRRADGDPAAPRRTPRRRQRRGHRHDEAGRLMGAPVETLVDPFSYQFFVKGFWSRVAGRRPVRAARRLRHAQGHELHRPRPLARDLRRVRRRAAARRADPPRRRACGGWPRRWRSTPSPAPRASGPTPRSASSPRRRSRSASRCSPASATRARRSTACSSAASTASPGPTCGCSSAVLVGRHRGVHRALPPAAVHHVRPRRRRGVRRQRRAHGHDPHDRPVDVDPRHAAASSASRSSRRRS